MARPVVHSYRQTHFSRALRRLRTDAGWSQAELAHRTGISQQAIASYERANPSRRPKWEHVVILAAHLEVDPWDLDPDLLAVVPADLQTLAHVWRHLPAATRRDLRRAITKALRHAP